MPPKNDLQRLHDARNNADADAGRELAHLARLDVDDPRFDATLTNWQRLRERRDQIEREIDRYADHRRTKK